MESCVQTLMTWMPDSALSRMIREVGETTSRIATQMAPRWSDGTYRAVNAAANNLVNQNPALEAASRSVIDTVYKAGLTGDDSPLSKLIAESSIYTKALFEKQGVSGALQHMINESTRDFGYMRSMMQIDDQTRGVLRSVSDQISASDISTLAQRAIGNVSYETLSAAYARLQEAGQIDEDNFEEKAVEALREVDEDYDPDAPPAAEELTSREALVALLIALRPDLSDDPARMRKMTLLAAGSGPLFYYYFMFFFPGVFLALHTLFEMIGVATVTAGGAKWLLTPGIRTEAQEPDDSAHEEAD